MTCKITGEKIVGMYACRCSSNESTTTAPVEVIVRSQEKRQPDCSSPLLSDTKMNQPTKLTPTVRFLKYVYN